MLLFIKNWPLWVLFGGFCCFWCFWSFFDAFDPFLVFVYFFAAFCWFFAGCLFGWCFLLIFWCFWCFVLFFFLTSVLDVVREQVAIWRVDLHLIRKSLNFALKTSSKLPQIRTKTSGTFYVSLSRCHNQQDFVLLSFNILVTIPHIS